MDEVIKILNDFSEKNNLWSKTKEAGIECVKNHLAEIKVENYAVEFVRKQQALIFWSYFDNSFIIRTTYNLKFNNIFPNDLKNTYSLDVNQSGEIIDDWLILS